MMTKKNIKNLTHWVLKILNILPKKRGWNDSIGAAPFEILVFNVYLAFLRWIYGLGIQNQDQILN